MDKIQKEILDNISQYIDKPLNLNNIEDIEDKTIEAIKESIKNIPLIYNKTYRNLKIEQDEKDPSRINISFEISLQSLLDAGYDIPIELLIDMGYTIIFETEDGEILGKVKDGKIVDLETK